MKENILYEAHIYIIYFRKAFTDISIFYNKIEYNHENENENYYSFRRFSNMFKTFFKCLIMCYQGYIWVCLYGLYMCTHINKCYVL